MAQILITGINGLLGSTLKEVLEKANHQIVGLDLPEDISNEYTIEKYKDPGFKLDWIVHTAAITDVNLCEKEQALCRKVNVEGTKNIRDLARWHEAKLIYISTVSVFDGLKGNYKEDESPSPQNFYSLTKLLGEQLILEYENGLVLRINLIGIHPAGSRGRNFFEWLIDALQNNQDISLFKDVFVNSLSNFTLAEMIEKLIEIEPAEKILHLASSNFLSKAEIAKIVLKRFKNYQGRAALISVDEKFKDVKRPKQCWLNSRYAQEKLGLIMPSLEEEVEKILNKASYD